MRWSIPFDRARAGRSIVADIPTRSSDRVTLWPRVLPDKPERRRTADERTAEPCYDIRCDGQAPGCEAGRIAVGVQQDPLRLTLQAIQYVGKDRAPGQKLQALVAATHASGKAARQHNDQRISRHLRRDRPSVGPAALLRRQRWVRHRT